MGAAGDWQRDALMRLPIVAFNGFWLVWEWQGLRRLIGSHPYLGSDGAFFLSVVARVTLLALLLGLVAFHLTRRRPVLKFATWRPKIDAFMGVTVGYFALLLPRPAANPLWDSLSIALMLGGNFFCILALTDLGRSLSIMPEARKLVTRGIYSRIRHPLYLGESIAFIGVLLQIRSWGALAIVAVQIGFLMRRLMWEETILAKAFPDYTDYCCRSHRLIPGVY